MTTELISKIDTLIEKYSDRLVSDTIKLVNIKSVQEKPSKRGYEKRKCRPWNLASR